jgi:Arc/MetJ-type ribon-helix-helix transcriptional regulator
VPSDHDEDLDFQPHEAVGRTAGEFRRYANASEYVCHLIRCDQERAEKIAHIQARVTEGIGAVSGVDPWTR